MKRKRIFVRVADDELEAIRARAAGAGLRVSAFMRSAALTLEISGEIPTEVRRAISGFARNLNQLAYHCNSALEAPPAQALEALRAEAFQIIEVLEKRGKNSGN